MRSRGISCLRLAKRARDFSAIACTLASAARNSSIASSMRSRFRLYPLLARSTWLSRIGIGSAAQHLGSDGEVEAVERMRSFDLAQFHRAVAERHAAVDADL